VRSKQSCIHKVAAKRRLVVAGMAGTAACAALLRAVRQIDAADALSAMEQEDTGGAGGRPQQQLHQRGAHPTRSRAPAPTSAPPDACSEWCSSTIFDLLEERNPSLLETMSTRK